MCQLRDAVPVPPPWGWIGLEGPCEDEQTTRTKNSGQLQLHARSQYSIFGPRCNTGLANSQATFFPHTP